MPLLTPPKVILFDWHGTLADTYDAMYNALDDAFRRMASMGLFNRLMDPTKSKTPEDARLVQYVREHQQLHPKIKAAKKVSRTDIFEVLFGPDDETKNIAHELYSECYRDHYGEVYPFEKDGRACLLELKDLGIRLGIVSNRNRDFLEHELCLMEEGQWMGLFDVVACGDDTQRRKPAPDILAKALEELGVTPGPGIWYVGDSTTDTASAKTHGLTSVFFNGAHWDQAWLDKIFPGTPEHPHQPDAIVEGLRELVDLAGICLNR
jgi:phosphoglycolate phosphatase